jgi:hypothetical protein
MNGTYVFVPRLLVSKKTVFLEVGCSISCYSLLFIVEEITAFYFKLQIFLKFSLLFKERDL